MLQTTRALGEGQGDDLSLQCSRQRTHQQTASAGRDRQSKKRHPGLGQTPDEVTIQVI